MILELGAEAMQVRLLEGPGSIRLAIRGELDLSTVAQLERELALAVVRAAGLVEVDLRDITFIDLAGLRYLQGVGQRAGLEGVTLANPSQAVQRLERLVAGLGPGAEGPTPA